MISLCYVGWHVCDVCEYASVYKYVSICMCFVCLHSGVYKLPVILPSAKSPGCGEREITHMNPNTNEHNDCRPLRLTALITRSWSTKLLGRGLCLRGETSNII